MALSFPLPAADFFAGIPVATISFAKISADLMSHTEGGDVLRHRRGPALWSGEITLGIATHDEIATADALVSRLNSADASVMLYDPRKPYPIADPGGVLLAGSNPVISTLDANNLDLSLAGLPAGYVLNRGDWIGWSYGANPTRHALHRIVTGATANGAGTTGLIEVEPRIRPGVGIGTAVSLAMPTLKAKIVDAQTGTGSAKVSQGGSLSWLQTLR